MGIGTDDVGCSRFSYKSRVDYKLWHKYVVNLSLVPTQSTSLNKGTYFSLNSEKTCCYNLQYNSLFIIYYYVILFAFSALTLLVWHQEQRSSSSSIYFPVRNCTSVQKLSDEVLTWSYVLEWSANNLPVIQLMPLHHCVSLKSRMVCLLGANLSRLSLKRGHRISDSISYYVADHLNKSWKYVYEIMYCVLKC